MTDFLPRVFYSDCEPSPRSRIQCVVKSTFTETRLVPALNDLLICNPSPAAVSRFRMGRLVATNDDDDDALRPPPPLVDGENGVYVDGSLRAAPPAMPRPYNSFAESGLRRSPRGVIAAASHHNLYNTVTRFGGVPFDVIDSLNVWSSGMWVSTGTGSTAAMHAAGGRYMEPEDPRLQYVIREHMFESSAGEDVREMNSAIVENHEQLHVRWNSHRGGIYIDGPHITHPLELGDEIAINNQAPPFQLFMRRPEYD